MMSRHAAMIISILALLDYLDLLFSWRKRAPSVFSRTVDSVDHEDIHRCAPRLELQTSLLLKRREDVGLVVGRATRDSRWRRATSALILKPELHRPAYSGLVDDGSTDEGREDSRDFSHQVSP